MLLAFLLGLAGLPADDDVKSAFKPRDVAGWTVKPFEDGCSAISAYDGGSILYVSYYYGYSNGYVMFGDPKFKSLKKGDKKNLKIILVKPRGRIDDGWGNQVFDAEILPSMNYLSVKLKDEIMADLAASQAIMFFTEDDVLVDAFKLTGSAAMIAALRECARIRQKENPVDPFL